MQSDEGVEEVVVTLTFDRDDLERMAEQYAVLRQEPMLPITTKALRAVLDGGSQEGPRPGDVLRSDKAAKEHFRIRMMRPPRDDLRADQAVLDGMKTDYWREVPCGHPPDPVAMRNDYGRPVCHCGELLDQKDGVEVEEAPGPVVHCQNCGCGVAIPKDPDCKPPSEGEEGEEDWPEFVELSTKPIGEAWRVAFEPGQDVTDYLTWRYERVVRSVTETGEMPPKLDEAIGLLRSSEAHDENCGIPHPADPDQSSRCTCGLESRVQRAEDLIVEQFDQIVAQRDSLLTKEQVAAIGPRLEAILINYGGDDELVTLNEVGTAFATAVKEAFGDDSEAPVLLTEGEVREKLKAPQIRKIAEEAARDRFAAHSCKCADCAGAAAGWGLSVARAAAFGEETADA